MVQLAQNNGDKKTWEPKYVPLTAKEKKEEAAYEKLLAAELSEDGKILTTNHAFLNNQKIKKAGIEMSFTKHQAVEYAKCQMDPVYFAKKYMKIVHVDEGLIPFDMYDYQQTMVRNLHANRFNIILAARQSGKSTTTVAFLLHYVVFGDWKTVAIIANKGLIAREILSRLQLAYEGLPHWMQSGVVSWNKGSFELENGCKVLAASTSSSAIRGFAISLLFVDEVAFIQQQTWTEFYRSVYPTISSGKKTKIVLVSTANGMNHFYNMIEGARKKKNRFVLQEIMWSDVPGRDEEWRQETIDNTDELTFRQEHCNEFIGGSYTLIGYDILKHLKNSVQNPIETRGDNIKVYEHPIKGHVYVASVDVSRGLLQDYSTMSIIDVTKPPFKQVMTFRDNSVSTLLLPSIIHNFAMAYNEAYVLVENNDMGGSVVERLNYDLEYPNILSIRSMNTKKTQLGMRCTPRTKSLGTARLKDQAESYQFIIPDEETVHELQTFVEDRTSYSAENGMNDDMVMGLVNFSYFTTTPLFEDVTEESFKKKFVDMKLAELEADLCPLPCIDDGVEYAVENRAFQLGHDEVTDFWDGSGTMEAEDMRNMKAEGFF